MTPLVNQLRWYTAIRVVAIVSVLLPYFLLQLWVPAPQTPPSATSAQPEPGFVGPPAPAAQTAPATAANAVTTPDSELVPSYVLWMLAITTFLATLLYIAMMRVLRRFPTIQAYIQFIGDLILITGLVYFLGGATSPFSLLYLIVIAVASTLLRRRAGLTVASIAFLLYGSLIVLLYFGKIHPATAGQEAVSGVRLFYNLTVHGFGFYAVALLTYYLAHNVTRAERALEEKSEHLADLQVVHRDVIQSITSGILTTDLAGIVTSANHAGLEILDSEEAEMLGRPIQESGLFTVVQWGEATAASEQTGRMRSEVEITRGTNTRYVGFSISGLSDAEHNHRGYIIIFQDLTRWRRMQEELRMRDRMVAVGELAAGLAHEIGNPLAAISGSVQMLSGSVDGDPAQRKLIEILLKESHRLDRTIKGFLRFARPRERSSVSFDIARLLAENFELLKNSEEVFDRHELEMELDPPTARLFADPDQVSQIFWNLARNALRAMPDGGRLRVVGRLQGDWYRVQVIDTGLGMSEEQRTNLFHPFQSFFDGGTGIGMAIVYRIVQDHGGRLHVDSRPGAGTTITAELPTVGSSVTLLSAEAPA
ncbi:MAG TPA: ATP-binding protein [Thermoanaerobaculia bacterium]|jgi:two-component system sensor histidine kinase PilS (NtrC family)|nr:ATP-binding protein [Thermoanaerobaculia bacterium]